MNITWENFYNSFIKPSVIEKRTQSSKEKIKIAIQNIGIASNLADSQFSHNFSAASRALRYIIAGVFDLLESDKSRETERISLINTRCQEEITQLLEYIEDNRTSNAPTFEQIAFIKDQSQQIISLLTGLINVME